MRRLATLATDQGVLSIPDLKSEAPQQFAASRLITTAHVDSLVPCAFQAGQVPKGSSRNVYVFTQATDGIINASKRAHSLI